MRDVLLALAAGGVIAALIVRMLMRSTPTPLSLAQVQRLVDGGPPPGWTEPARPSRHFTWRELDRHGDRDRLRAWHLHILATHLLEPVRAWLGGAAITITPNGGLHGATMDTYHWRSSGSQHRAGLAADIRVRGLTARAVQGRLDQGRHFGVLPIGGLGRYPAFTHIDLGESRSWTGE